MSVNEVSNHGRSVNEVSNRWMADFRQTFGFGKVRLCVEANRLVWSVVIQIERCSEAECGFRVLGF